MIYISGGEKEEFIIKVEKNEKYSVSLLDESYWGIELEMFVCNGPYGTIGKYINEGESGENENFVFTASKTGLMSVIVRNNIGRHDKFTFNFEYSTATETYAKLSVIPGVFVGRIFPFLFLVFNIIGLLYYSQKKMNNYIEQDTNNLLRITKIDDVFAKKDMNITESEIEELITDYLAVKKYYKELELDLNEKIEEKLLEIDFYLEDYLLNLVEHHIENNDYDKADSRVFDAKILLFENPRFNELKDKIEKHNQTITAEKQTRILKELNEKRKEKFNKIINRYATIDLVEMAEILNFDDKIALQEWLLSLSDDFKFIIEDDLVILPKGLKGDK